MVRASNVRVPHRAIEAGLSVSPRERAIEDSGGAFARFSGRNHQLPAASSSDGGQSLLELIGTEAIWVLEIGRFARSDRHVRGVPAVTAQRRSRSATSTLQSAWPLNRPSPGRNKTSTSGRLSTVGRKRPLTSSATASGCAARPTTRIDRSSSEHSQAHCDSASSGLCAADS